MGLDFSTAGWILLIGSAIVIGIGKTSIGGVGMLAIAAVALVLPPKDATGAVLLLLMTGDLVAVTMYRRSADWGMLLRLLVAVLPGIALGALLINVISDQAMILIVALCLLVVLLLQIVQRIRGSRPAAGERAAGEGVAEKADRTAGADGDQPAAPVRPHPSATVSAGMAAGFTTMVANAAGPVMALYLLAARVDKLRFLGTNAWFFLMVNLCKVPFAAGVGILPASTLRLTLVLVPFVLLGAFAGRRLLRGMDLRLFERLTLGAAAFSTLVLFIRALSS